MKDVTHCRSCGMIQNFREMIRTIFNNHIPNSQVRTILYGPNLKPNVGQDVYIYIKLSNGIS